MYGSILLPAVLSTNPRFSLSDSLPMEQFSTSFRLDRSWEYLSSRRLEGRAPEAGREQLADGLKMILPDEVGSADGPQVSVCILNQVLLMLSKYCLSP